MAAIHIIRYAKMKKSYVENKIDGLKKTISLLEWDIRFIKDSNLKSLKLSQLDQHKKDLRQLQNCTMNNGETRCVMN